MSQNSVMGGLIFYFCKQKSTCASQKLQKTKYHSVHKPKLLLGGGIMIFIFFCLFVYTSYFFYNNLLWLS